MCDEKKDVAYYLRKAEDYRVKAIAVSDPRAKSGATRTPIPAQGGQQSGDCGQQVMAA